MTTTAEPTTETPTTITADNPIGDTTTQAPADPTAPVLPTVELRRARRKPKPEPRPTVQVADAPVHTIALASILPSPENARRQFPERELAELAESIRIAGLVQPITVRPIAAHGTTPGHYEIVAGERRFRAYLRLRDAHGSYYDRIPATVRDLTDDEARQLRAIENLHRADLTPFEEAAEFAALLVGGVTLADVAAVVGKDVGYVRNRVQLTHLTDDARKLIDDGKIPLGAAFELARLTPPDQLAVVAKLRDQLKYHADLTKRDVVQAVGSTVIHDLERAPFDTTAENLIPGVIACTHCPHNSAANRDLFADVKGQTLCTNRPCFTAKTQAGLDAKFAQLEAGTVPPVRVSTRFDAKPGNGVLSSSDYTRLYDHQKDTCDDTRIALVVDTYHGNLGDTFRVCLGDRCKVHGTSGVGRAGMTDAQRAKQREQNRQLRAVAWSKAALLTAVLQRPMKLDLPLMKLIVARFVAETQSEACRMAVKALDGEAPKIGARDGTAAEFKPDPALGMVYSASGAQAILLRRVADAKTIEALLPVCVALSFAFHVHSSGYTEEKWSVPLTKFAKRVGVDAARVRRAAMKEIMDGKPKTKAKAKDAPKAKAKPAAKRTRTTTAKRRSPPRPMFMKPQQPSPELAAIVGSAPLPRTEIVKKLWGYIKRKGLQDAKTPRTINADAKLGAVFGGKKAVSMFDMTRHVNKHLSPAE